MTPASPEFNPELSSGLRILCYILCSFRVVLGSPVSFGLVHINLPSDVKVFCNGLVCHWGYIFGIHYDPYQKNSFLNTNKWMNGHFRCICLHFYIYTNWLFLSIIIPACSFRGSERSHNKTIAELFCFFLIFLFNRYSIIAGSRNILPLKRIVKKCCGQNLALIKEKLIDMRKKTV